MARLPIAHRWVQRSRPQVQGQARAAHIWVSLSLGQTRLCTWAPCCWRAQQVLEGELPSLACQHPARPPSLPSSAQVALGSLFHGLDVGFLQPTSLTLLYPLASPSNSTDVYLEPMEVATFRLRLG